MMRRVQTFVVTVETPYKDSCGMYNLRISEGDIRRAVCGNLPVESAEVSVSEGKEKIKKN